MIADFTLLEEIQDEDSVDEIKERFLERENIIDDDKVSDINDTDLNIAISPQWYLQSHSQEAGTI